MLWYEITLDAFVGVDRLPPANSLSRARISYYWAGGYDEMLHYGHKVELFGKPFIAIKKSVFLDHPHLNSYNGLTAVAA